MWSCSSASTRAAASLATVLKYYFGEDVAEERILVAALGDLDAEQLLDRHENGLSMEDLRRGASALGYPAAVLEVSYEKLVGLPAR